MLALFQDKLYTVFLSDDGKQYGIIGTPMTLDANPYQYAGFIEWCNSINQLPGMIQNDVRTALRKRARHGSAVFTYAVMADDWDRIPEENP